MHTTSLTFPLFVAFAELCTTVLNARVSSNIELANEVEIDSEIAALENSIAELRAKKKNFVQSGNEAPYVEAGSGVAGPTEQWNVGGAQGKGVQACYDAVMASDTCAKDFFSYVHGDDKNCGCKGSTGALSVRSDGVSTYYSIKADATANHKDTVSHHRKSWSTVPPEEVATKEGISPLDKSNIDLLDMVKPLEWVNPNSNDVYDLVAIGSGAGGLVSSKQSARRGARSALIERHLSGGDCLNFGCVPSKALLHRAKAFRHVRANDSLSYDELNRNFGSVMAEVRSQRTRIAPDDSYEGSQSVGVDVYQGTAAFTGRDTIVVGGHTLRFRKAVVATGGSFSVPEWVKGVKFDTAHTVWNLEQLPRRIVIVGAGPIGLEMAQAFSILGSHVTVIIRTRAISKMPKEASDVIQAALEADGVVFEQTLPESMTATYVPQGKTISVKGIRKGTNSQVDIQCDMLFAATGKKPSYPEGLLDKAGVQVSPKGIIVDDNLKTSNPNILAVGDVVAGVVATTHVAGAMAQMAVENALFNGDRRLSELAVPLCVYTEPEVAHTRRWNLVAPHSTYLNSLQHNHRAILDQVSPHRLVRLEVGPTNIVTGATIVAPSAGEMIFGLTTAIQLKATMDDLSKIIHPYPTINEGVGGAVGQWRSSSWAVMSSANRTS